jgi:hypothetical protein
VILPVIWFVESIRETSGEHAIPEVVPLQQITYNAFAIQQVIANTPKEFEVQALDRIDICLLLFFSHWSFIPRGPPFSW